MTPGRRGSITLMARAAAVLAVSAIVTALLVEAVATACALLDGGLGGRTGAAAQRTKALAELGGERIQRENPRQSWLNSRVIHPFFGYTDNPALPGVNNFGFDTPYDIGLCGTSYCLKGVSGHPLVVGIFGGSFARRVAHHGGRYFEERLAEIFPDRTPVVVNFGMAGHAMPQAAFIFLYFRDLIDVAVFLDGLNEVLNPVGNNQAGVPPEYAVAAPFKYKLSLNELSPKNFELTRDIVESGKWLQRVTGWSLQPPLRQSLAVHYAWNLCADSLRRRMQHAMRDIEQSYSQAQAFFDVPDEQLIEFGARRWESYHQLVHQVAASAGIWDLHLIQPSPHVPNSKSLTVQERDLLLRDDRARRCVEQGYPRLRAGLTKLQQQGAIGEDLSFLFTDVQERVWKDPYHVNDRGGQIVLDRVADLVRAHRADLLVRAAEE